MKSKLFSPRHKVAPPKIIDGSRPYGCQAPQMVVKDTHLAAGSREGSLKQQPTGSK